jgi:hypothetical protein
MVCAGGPLSLPEYVGSDVSRSSVIPLVSQFSRGRRIGDDPWSTRLHCSRANSVVGSILQDTLTRCSEGAYHSHCGHQRFECPGKES